jgi:hypothetical protein
MADDDPALVGNELGVELADLYKCGEMKMPNLADHFRNAANGIPGDQLAWPFQRATDVGLMESGPYLAWRQLADLLVEMLRSTEDSIRDTADNMVRAAKDYAATDDAAATEYEKKKREIDREVAGTGAR